MRPARLDLPAFCFCDDLQHLVKKDGRYACEPFEFAIASLDEVFVFHLGIGNLQDIFARGLLFLHVVPTAAEGVLILKVHWTTFSARLPMVPSMPCVMPCSVRRVSVAFADISVWLWQRCWTNLLLKLRDRRRSAPISSFQNEIREGEVTIGVRGIIVPSRVNAGSCICLANRSSSWG